MPSDCVNLAEDLYEVVCVCYLLVRWYVCVLSSSRKCYEMLGPEDKNRWEDVVYSFMKKEQLPVSM